MLFLICTNPSWDCWYFDLTIQLKKPVEETILLESMNGLDGIILRVNK